MRALVSIEIHDVAPATWARCAALLERLDAIGSPQVTLLVVPWYHRGVALDRAPLLIEAISKRIARGDEAALHGFVHLDEAASPCTVRGFVERRLCTRREGEFAAIDAADAHERLGRAIAMWRRTGWPLYGFVPPAWLLGREARAAIARDMPFGYVALRGAIFRLPGWQPLTTDVLCYSSTSTPRRWLSRVALAVATARASSARLLRIALHPQDAHAPGVLDHWQAVIESALAERAAVTTRAALAEIAPVAHSQYGVAL